MNSPAPQRRRVPRIAEEAMERARLSVVPRTRSVRTAKVPFVILVSMLLLTGVVGLLLFNTSMQQASFAASTLEERARNLQAREQALSAELEVLRDPQRIGEKARELGMRTPPAPTFLYLADGTVSGEEIATPVDDGESIAPPAPVVPAELVVPKTPADTPARNRP